jgi:CBS domain-containing protein
MEAALNNLFQNTTLGEVVAYRTPHAPRELVSVEPTSSVHACLKAMADKKVSAVPVIDATQNKVVGMVDMVDVCRTLVNKLADVDEWKSWPDVKFSELLDETQVSQVVDFAHGDPLLISNAAASVGSVMKFFSSGLAHHLLVNYDNEREFGILSQVDVANWLASKVTEDLDFRKFLMEVPLIGELKNRASKTHQVVQAQWTESVYDILKKLVRENVHAIALVDEEGRLQGNFSATDLVHIDLGSVSDIRLSGKEYLTKYSRWSLTPLAILDNEKSTLAESIMLFSGIGIHRIWLVDSPMDSKFSPTGVISVTDVLQIVHSHM